MAKVIFACLLIYAVISVLEKHGAKGIWEVVLSVTTFTVLTGIVLVILVSIWYIAT